MYIKAPIFYIKLKKKYEAFLNVNLPKIKRKLYRNYQRGLVI